MISLPKGSEGRKDHAIQKATEQSKKGDSVGNKTKKIHKSRLNLKKKLKDKT